MSTTPNGSALSEDDLTLPNKTNSPAKNDFSDEDFHPIEGEKICQRSETFELPKSKKFKPSNNILTNGTERDLSAKENTNVEAMEHTNGGSTHNGVKSNRSFRCFLFKRLEKKKNKTNSFLFAFSMVLFRKEFLHRSFNVSGSNICTHFH